VVFKYHALPGNLIRLGGFRLAVCRLWRQVLKRRSQRNRLQWSRDGRLATSYLDPKMHAHTLKIASRGCRARVLNIRIKGRCSTRGIGTPVSKRRSQLSNFEEVPDFLTSGFPYVADVFALHRYGYCWRAESGYALMPTGANAVVQEPPRFLLAELFGKCLCGTIVGWIRVMQVSKACANIVHRLDDLVHVRAHRQLYIGLIGRREESFLVEAGLGDGRALTAGRVVDTECSIGEPADLPYMRERGHNRR